jgi:hypothetical protein
METQKFMGRNQLVERLTERIGSREGAIAVLRQRGQMEANSEKLTPLGMERDAMTAAERVKDRAAKAANKNPAQFKYNPKTNRATLKRR